MLNFKTLALPSNKRHTQWEMPNSAATALNLLHSLKGAERQIVVVAEDTQAAERFLKELQFFAGKQTVKAEIFVDTETLPYDPFSPHQTITSKRLSVLSRLSKNEISILIVSIATLMQRLCPPSFLYAYVLALKVGDKFDRENFRSQLTQAGYNSVSQVLAPGEFAIRGAVFDLFPMGYDLPIRIDCFDDRIDTLRTFEIETQKTIAKIEKIELLPAREFETNTDGIARFRSKFRETFASDPNKSSIYTEVTKGHFPAGIEAYLPLFFEATATLFDYFPSNTTLITLANVAKYATQASELINRRYESYRHNIERPLLAPAHLYLSLPALNGAIAALPHVDIIQSENILKTTTLSGLNEWLDQQKIPTLICVESSGRKENLLEKFKTQHIEFTTIEHFDDFASKTPRLGLIIGLMDQGFIHTKPDFAVITEYELLGVKAKAHTRKAKVTDPSQILNSLDSINIDDPIVHIAHGVGRYKGLEILDDTEFVVLEYANGGKLYVPVASLDLLSRFSGGSVDHVPWHKLGSDQWEKACKKARERIFDVAAELLEIYAKREMNKTEGIRFDEQEYQQFAESFPFEETPDQENAILAVKQDLQVGKMDRIVCGDVGFGKTEVAMRAAFLCVSAGKQVAMLAPTTLLAEQHAKNFADRFSDWPIRIASLSRFRSAKESKEIMAELSAGRLDIVIGTHKLLSDDVAFKSLGLVIIDEEHRFGVRQKEKFKALRAEVNILTMTATPIPRTLNMGLSGLKQLSIIATPPEGRLSVKTFVNEWNDSLIIEALEREFKRGGQVYFLHNDVQTIESTKLQLEALIPDISIGIAHGQMAERELEQVMLDFYHHRINLLLCTTIVESGIDIPTANTIIINRADKLGLAQLHQLRGRVGRSSHRAYCYLIVPHHKSMTPDAVRRIEALSSLDELGSGFMLANHDLEIRGVGEFLGEAQSGQIHEIGFTLYMDLLSRTVEALKKGESLDATQGFAREIEVNLGQPALIPEDYLPDVHTRLTLYKRISNAKDYDQLIDLQIEMVDRFGTFPEQIKTLFKVSEIKLYAKPMNLKKIEVNKDGVRISFGDKPNINLLGMIELVQSKPNFYQLQGQEVLKYKLPLDNLELRTNATLEILKHLAVV